MVHNTAKALRIAEGEVLVASTGVIGQYLRWTRSTAASRWPWSVSGRIGTGAAEAIRTTNTFSKEAAARCNVGQGSASPSAVWPRVPA